MHNMQSTSQDITCNVYTLENQRLLQGFGEGSIFSAACEAPAASPVPDDIPASPSAKPASPEDPGAAKSLKPAATPREGEPHSAFVFAVRDGRLGSITVSDRGAAKRVVAPPRWSLQFVDQLSATGMAATGSLVFLGDDSGVLYQWATDTGETRVVPVGKKSIRTVLLAPPASPHLTPEPPPGAAQGRMLLVFGDGTYAVRHISYGYHVCRLHLSGKSRTETTRDLLLAHIIFLHHAK
jgi:hypothetical protein